MEHFSSVLLGGILLLAMLITIMAPLVILAWRRSTPAQRKAAREARARDEQYLADDRPPPAEGHDD